MESHNVEERTDDLRGVDDAETNADLNQILTEYDYSLMKVPDQVPVDHRRGISTTRGPT